MSPAEPVRPETSQATCRDSDARHGFPSDHSAAAFGQRYGAGAGILPLRLNETIEVMLAHRSVRSYRSDPLPAGTLETIVAAAQSAPSSSNLQAWSVVAVQDTERKRRLAALAGPNRQIEAAPLLLVFIADLARSRAVALRKDAPGAGLDYFEAFLLAAIDATLAAQNAVTALESLGLGSCYIGAMRNHPAEIADELGLPPEAIAVFGLTVGVPDPNANEDVKPRLPQVAVLHRETYRATYPEEEFARYDEVLRSFQRSQRMPERGWTDTIAQRVGTVKALNGRDRLFAIARSLGFGLR